MCHAAECKMLILIETFLIVIVVQLLRCVRLFVTPWTEEHQASPGLHHLPECA